MNIMELLTVGRTVIRSAGIWLAAGEGSSSLIKSTDGIYWTAAGNPLGSGVIRGLANSAYYTGGELNCVAVGNTSDNVSTISISSNNGSTWSLVAEDPFTGGQANSVTFFSYDGITRFIVVGVVNGVQKIVFSEDLGLTWTAYSTPDISGVFTNVVSFLEYNHETGQNTPFCVATCPTQSPSMAVLTTEWANIPAANDPFPGGCTAFYFTTGFSANGQDYYNLWIAGGQNKLAISTTRGTTWTTVYTGTNFLPSDITYDYNNNRIVVCGTSILTSTDLVTWTPVELPFSGNLTSIHYEDLVMVTTGHINGGLAMSTNGIIWFLMGGHNIIDPLFRGEASTVRYLNGRWFVGGYGTHSLGTSEDTLTWTSSNPFGVGGRVLDIASATDLSGITTYVAVGHSSNSLSSIAYSTDGITWSISNATDVENVTNETIMIAHNVLHFNNTWYVLGSLNGGGSAIQTSQNGINWTQAHSTTTNLLILVKGLDGSGNHLFLSIGSIGNEGLIPMEYSSDGIEWHIMNAQNTPYDIINIPVYVLYYTSAPYNGATRNLWVAGSTGSLKVSTNGFDWTTVYTDEGYFTPYSIIYDGTWTVFGNSTNYNIITSPDLITWTTVRQPAFISGNTIMAAASNNSILVAAGQGNYGTIGVRVNGTWSVVGALPLPPLPEPPASTAPSNVTAVPSNTSALVSWTAPNSQVTGYKIYSLPDNKLANTAGPNATSLNVTGLKNGIPYTFSVVATTAIGSSYMATCTPSTLPGVPKVTAVAANAQVTLSWVSAPAPGVSTTGFTVTCNQSVSLPENPTSPLVITGLTNGLSYIFSVRAMNIIGTSAAGVSKAVIPTSIPDVPTSFAVLPGSKSFQVTWAAPFNGGLPITEYAITYVTGTSTKVAKGKATAPFTLMVTKLVTGTSYSVSIQAKNKLGLSAATQPIQITVQ